MKSRTLSMCALIALTIVAACKRTGNIDENDPNKITIPSSIDGAKPAKALALPSVALDDIQLLRKDDQATDLISINFKDSLPITAARLAGDDSEITFNTPQKYDMLGNKASYFVGYHPAGILDQATDVVTWTPNGATDILVSDLYNAGTYRAQKKPTMTFNHALARIEIVLKAKVGCYLPDVQTLWGKITNINVENMPTTITYDYATCALAAGGTMDKAELLKGSTYTVDAIDASADGVIGAADNVDIKFASMVVPVGRTDFVVNVTNDGLYGKTVSTKGATLSQNMSAGKTHRLTITFGIDPTDIKITSSVIVAWDANGGTGGIELPKPPKPIVTSIVIGNLAWAVGNLISDGANGAKIGKPEDGGLYFTFGSLIGWAGGATGDGVGVPADGTPTTPALAVQVKPATYGGSTNYPGASYRGGSDGDPLPATDDAVTGIGDPCRYYLGVGWRTPTVADWELLIPLKTMNDATSKVYWSTAKKGAYANADSNVGGANSLFLPAAGTRRPFGGAVENVGTESVYYTSTCSSKQIRFNSSSIAINGTNADCGNAIRCVKSVAP